MLKAVIIAISVYVLLLCACPITVFDQTVDVKIIVPTPVPTPDQDKKFIITDKLTPVVKASNIIRLIRVKMMGSKGISGKQLANFANELVKREGYDYTFSWEPKGKLNETNLAMAGHDYYPFHHSLTDITGRKHKFQFLNDDFGHPCFSTINIPVTRVSEREINVISDGREIELKRPKDFYLEEMALVDKTLKKKIRVWKTPIDATPVGISSDGTKIYFDSWEFYQNQNEGYAEQPIGLAIELSADGRLRFVDVQDIPSSKGVELDHENKYSEITYTKYSVQGKEYVVKSSAPCT